MTYSRRIFFIKKNTSLRVCEREVDPSVAEDLPVARVDVVEAGHQAGVNGRLDRDLALGPGRRGRKGLPLRSCINEKYISFVIKYF